MTLTNRLIVRTSPANLGELRHALQALDVPLRRLQISVRFDGHSRPTRERRYLQTPGGVISQQVVIVQDQSTGFEVLPRLAGQDEVALELSGATVTARLGEWIELGRVAHSGPYRTELQGVWLKVDQVAD